jgi:hypothetical protein
MAGSRRGQAIPTQLGLALFEQFVLAHLSTGSRGPAPKLSLFKIFNYVLHLLYIGCQWKELESAEFSATLLRLVTCAHSRRAKVR